MVTTRACHSANKVISHHDGDKHNARNRDGGIKENDGNHNDGNEGSVGNDGDEVNDGTTAKTDSFLPQIIIMVSVVGRLPKGAFSKIMKFPFNVSPFNVREI